MTNISYTETSLLKNCCSIYRAYIAEVMLLFLMCFILHIVELVSDTNWISPEEETGLLTDPSQQGQSYEQPSKQSQKYELPKNSNEGQGEEDKGEECEEKKVEQFNYNSENKEDQSQDKNLKSLDGEISKEENKDPYTPYEQNKLQKSKAMIVSDFVSMTLREEVWYHFMYHIIALGLCCFTWLNATVIVFAYFHLGIFAAWIALRILDNKFAKYAMFANIGINGMLVIFALANWNSSG